MSLQDRHVNAGKAAAGARQCSPGCPCSTAKMELVRVRFERRGVESASPSPPQSCTAHSPRTPWFCHTENCSLTQFPWSGPGFTIMQLSTDQSWFYWAPPEGLLFWLGVQFYLRFQLDQQRGNSSIRLQKELLFLLSSLTSFGAFKLPPSLICDFSLKPLLVF